MAEATRLLKGVRPRDPVGFVSGYLPIERVRGRRVSLGGWIQTRAVQGARQAPPGTFSKIDSG